MDISEGLCEIEDIAACEGAPDTEDMSDAMSMPERSRRRNATESEGAITGVAGMDALSPVDVDVEA